MMLNLWTSLSYEFILVVLGSGSLLSYLIGRSLEKYKLEKLSSGGIALLTLGVSLLALIFIKASGTPSSLFVFHSFAKYVGGIILSCSFLISIASISYTEIEYYPEYFSLLLASTLGMLLIPISNNLILLYTSWELMSIPAYVLVALKKEKREALEGTLKYFIFGAISSILIIYGMSIFYSLTGTLTITQLSASLGGEWKAIEYIGIITLTAGFGIKVGIVPFHMWIPDTYQSGPLTTSLFLTTSSKNAGFGAIAKVLILGLTLNSLLQYEIQNLLAILALVTMIGGNIFALIQKNVIRMLAYSSITHAGYILVGMAVASTSSRGLTASLFHLLTYSVSDVAAFICAIFFISIGAKTIDDYEGIGNHAKFTSFVMAFALLSLAGVPGLAGFASKFTLFFAGLEGEMLWLSIGLALNSAFSLGYYGRLIKRMFLHQGNWQKDSLQLPKGYFIALIISLGLIFLIGIKPGFFVELANNGTSSLFPS